jgi:hypothetical protein
MWKARLAARALSKAVERGHIAAAGWAPGPFYFPLPRDTRRVVDPAKEAGSVAALLLRLDVERSTDNSRARVETAESRVATKLLKSLWSDRTRIDWNLPKGDLRNDRRWTTSALRHRRLPRPPRRETCCRHHYLRDHLLRRRHLLYLHRPRGRPRVRPADTRRLSPRLGSRY